LIFELWVAGPVEPFPGLQLPELYHSGKQLNEISDWTRQQMAVGKKENVHGEQ